MAIHNPFEGATWPMPWPEFLEAMSKMGISMEHAQNAFARMTANLDKLQGDRKRFEDLQNARRKHWGAYGGSFHNGRSHFSDLEEFKQQQERENAYGKQYTRDRPSGPEFVFSGSDKSGFSYDPAEDTYSFYIKIDDNGFEYMAEPKKHQPMNYRILTPVPGLNGWSMPCGYLNYSKGPLKGSHTRIDKNAPINTKAFEAIPFQYIPPELNTD